MAKKSKSSAENANVCAGLAYMLVGIIWYFVDEKMRKDALVTSHVKQALVALIVSFSLSIVARVLFFVPLLGLLIWLLHVGLLVIVIINAIAAFQGTEKELPLIGKFGEKFTF